MLAADGAFLAILGSSSEAEGGFSTRGEAGRSNWRSGKAMVKVVPAPT